MSLHFSSIKNWKPEEWISLVGFQGVIVPGPADLMIVCPSRGYGLGDFLCPEEMQSRAGQSWVSFS